MCTVGQRPQEHALIQVTTFDLEFTLEIRIEVPSVDFNHKTMLEQIKLNMFKWCRGARINKNALAEVMGIDNRDWVSLRGFDLHANDEHCTATKYGASGRRLDNDT